MAIELNNISSGYNLSAINDNFQKLEDALNNNVLWRTGSVAGETLMLRDIDMNGHTLLNLASDPSNPGSILTISVADARYYNVAGDTLTGDMNAGGHRITNLSPSSAVGDAVRKGELDAEEAARQSADANLQEQITGSTPLEASAFSEISWHGRQIANSVTIPANKNAWSFGPQMEIAEGQLVTISPGSMWTIADGRLVEDEDLHHLIADSLRTADGTVTVNVADIASNTSVNALDSRLTAEENKVNDIAHGGTGATTASAARTNLGLGTMATQAASGVAITGGSIVGITDLAVADGGTGASTAATARTNLGAAASGANTDITSITGSAASLTTSRTFVTNLASTTAAGFNGTANNSHGVTGTLPIANGGTNATTATGALTSLGAFPAAGVVDASEAAAGRVGEVLSASTTNTATSTTVALNATSLTLTAGDWDVTGSVQFTPNGATYGVLQSGINTTSASLPPFPYRQQSVMGGYANADQSFPVIKRRINVATTTTIYLVARAEFTGGTSPTVSGFLEARRER